MKNMDKSAGFGKRFFLDEHWELVAQDEDNVPYFSKVIDGVTQKERVKLIQGEYIAQK